MLTAFVTWDVSPELFNILGREIRWYGLMWALGLLVAVWTVQKIYTSEKIPQKEFDSLFLYIVISLIIGARLGHCLLYDPIHYLTHPWEILEIWKGGLASHGGVLGMIIGSWLYSRKVHRNFLWVVDRVVVPAALTGSLIRIGNLMNSEIYGKPTTLPWGFEFVRDPMWWKPLAEGGSGALPCHPTQIYEALAYALISAIAMYLFWKTNYKQKEGFIFGLSVTLVFVARIFLEFFKNIQEPFELQLRASIGLDMGQLLSIPFVLCGIWLMYRAEKINK